MTVEEKAKAYDKAIEKIKYVMEHGVQPVFNKEDLQDIFPELKESEDERIRKDIIKFLIDVNNGAFTKSELEIASWIAWLEKQGEKPQVDGFDAELNALLKKYEYLPNDEMVECLKFYTAELINNKQRMEQ